MPRHEAGIVRLLDEEAGIPAQDVRPQQVFDRIEDFGVADHLVDPAEQHMAAMAHLAADRAAALGLVRLELAAEARDFARGKRVDRKMVAMVAIEGDLGLAQHLGHGFFSGIAAVILRERRPRRHPLSSSGDRNDEPA